MIVKSLYARQIAAPGTHRSSAEAMKIRELGDYRSSVLWQYDDQVVAKLHGF